MKKCIMLLVVSMLLIMAPMSAAADGNNITLGAGAITKGNKVYFGNQILWRVLNVGARDGLDVCKAGSALLISNDILTSIQFNTNKYAQNANAWAGSNAQTWCTNYYNGWPNAIEKGAILPTSVTEENSLANGNTLYYYYYSNSNIYFGAASLNNERVFFLSAKEADKLFENDDDRKTSGENDWWWLRSPSAKLPDHVGHILSNGKIYINFVNNVYEVRPAFNLNLSSILFSSEISAGIYKLTLLDSKMVVAEGSAGISRSGNTITVPYSITGDNAGNANHVSLLITNKGDAWNSTSGWSTGAVKQYYTTAAVTGTSGTVTLTLPNNYEANRANWKVWLLAEQVNGEKKTDYASAPVPITIPYQLKYDSNGGSGNMASVNVYEGNQFTFPECRFTAPQLKIFDHWKMSGVDGIFYAPNSTVQIASNCAQNGVITVTAYWKEAPQATINPVPQAKNLIYSGSAQELVTAGASSGGTMYYAIGTDGTTAPTSGWSTSIPTATTPGTYYVWYKAIGDKDHSDSDPASTKAEIGKKAATVTAKAQTVNEGGSIKKGTDQATLSDAIEGHKLSKITLTAADNKIVPSGAKIIDKNKKDMTGNYDISYVDGALTTKKTISAKVTFKVVNGSWDDGTATDKTVVLKGSEGETLKLAAKDIPSVGSKPNAGYKAGSWDVTPMADAAITKDTTYIYSYVQNGSISQTVTFKVVNGSWDDGTAADKTVTLKGYEGDTLKLSSSDIPAVGSRPNAGYKAGGWDVAPSTDTAITRDTTYTYTYVNGGVEPAPTPTPTLTQEPITIPKAPSGVKATAKKDKVTVTWKKIKKTQKTKALRAQIKSIQVQYATDANFTQNVGSKTVGKNKTKAVLKLQRKTTYYVRVRYVGADGVSAWSKVKRVKTK